MRTPWARGEHQQLDLYPEWQACPAWHPTMHERYHKQRWIMRLDQHVKVVSHFLECGNLACTQRAVVYRPSQAEARAWRGYTFGLDVVACMGALRYRDNFSITKSRDQLQTESHLAISLKEVALLCEVLLALVTTVARQDQAWAKQLRPRDSIVLASDGVQPEKSHETLDILRDVGSGRVLVAKTLLSRASGEMEQLIEEVLGLWLPIVGVMSEKQESIGLAGPHKLPTVPHQMCQYQYLQDVAHPVCEADRHVKKELNKTIRGLRASERQADQWPTKEAQVVADDSLAIQTVMRDHGKYPLEPPGVQLYQTLPLMAASVERVKTVQPSVLRTKLARMLSVLKLFQKEYEKFVMLFSWIYQLAHL